AHARDVAVKSLGDCYLAFPSVEHDRGHFLWIGAPGHLDGPPEVEGWEVRYVVDRDGWKKSPRNPATFVSVSRRWYTRDSWQKEEPSLRESTFASSLVIP